MCSINFLKEKRHLIEQKLVINITGIFKNYRDNVSFPKFLLSLTILIQLIGSFFKPRLDIMSYIGNLHFFKFSDEYVNNQWLNFW